MGKRKSPGNDTADKGLKKPKRVRRCGSMLPPPTPRIDRTMSCTSEISMSQVSPRVRDTLLNMERVRKIKHPFSAENQEVFQEFQDSVRDTALQDLKLTEMALLLRGVMSLWKRQMGSCISDIHNLAAFVTNAQPAVIDVDNQTEGNDEFPLDKEEDTQNINSEKIDESATIVEGLEKDGSKESERPLETVIEQNNTLESSEHNSQLAVSEVSIDKDGSEKDPLLSASCDNINGKDISQLISAESNPQEGSEKVENLDGANVGNPATVDLLNDTSKTKEIVNTRKRIANYSDLLHPAVFKLLGYDEESFKVKRPRKDALPPILVPYYDIPIQTNISEDAEPEVLINELEWVKPKRIRKPNCLNDDTIDSLNEADPSSDVATSEQTDSDKNVPTDDGFPGDKPSLLSSEEISKLEFSPEDISEIQRWITQLHYLPFTCELSNAEVKGTFENLLQRLSVIFKKYGVPVNGHMIKLAASDVCAQISSTYQDLFKDSEQILKKKVLDDSQTPPQTPGDEDASLQEETGITIMERVTEKTITESQVRMREMISEMQRSIVPKYARIPLIEENTAEFFRRVKLFEEKMKKVLACEEKKEEFDVRKYEMDVLEAANKETQDQDSSDISQYTQIPSPITNLINEKFGGFEENLGITFHGLPSPSSSESSDSQKWVPLTQIFAHMKKMEKPEAARVFYAVLALLSFQNLDVKYENHYSAESVAITSKSLDHAQDTKYPRGLKIMSSRCPDVDREEIYLSPLTSLSRTNAFRQLEIRESELHESLGIARMRFSRNSGSSDEVINGDLTHDIEREFIKSDCTVYKGKLFGKSRARRVTNKEPVVKKTRRKLEFSKSAEK